MAKSLYPEVHNESDVVRALQEIINIRENEDISDFKNLNNIFVAGRARGQQRAAPSSNSDVLATDSEGDYVNDGTYEYKLLNVSGTLKWHRVALSVAW